MRKLRIILPVIVIGSCYFAPLKSEENKNVDGLISEIFGSPPSQPTTEHDLKGVIDEIFKPTESQHNTYNENSQNQDAGSNHPAGIPQSGENCECVPYYQCQNGTILENGVGLIDIRLQSGPCPNYLDVCCTPPNLRDPGDKITPPPQVRRGCGFRNPEGIGFRITGAKNNEAQFGEFPWMVAILREENINNNAEKLNVYQCGGALIHPKVVLTAAHCVNGKSPSMLKVRAGEWDTQTKNEIFPHQDRLVDSVIVHEHFHPGTLFNDVALLILNSPVDYADNVDIVCLPEPLDMLDRTRCFASGWGKDTFGKAGHYQVILKKIDLPIVPHGSCQSSLRQTRLGHYFVLDQSFICAGGEPGKDTCQGDGGSPLVCPLQHDPTRYVQAGIVAWGIGCGENLIPGVYTNVANARKWIDQQLTYYNLDNSVYRYSSH